MTPQITDGLKSSSTFVPNPNFPEYQMLYGFALDCADRRFRHTCEHSCFNCMSNVEKYGLSERERNMLQHAADIQVRNALIIEQLEEQKKIAFKKKWALPPHAVRNWVLKSIGITAIICLVAYLLIRRPEPPIVNIPAPIVNVAAPNVSVPAPIVNVPAPIVNVTTPNVRVSEPIRQTTDEPAWATPTADMNKDGLVNCIDYALRFYESWRDMGDVRIMYSASVSRPGQAHLFGRFNGVDYECRTSETLDDHWKGIDTWPNRIDVTAEYADIKAGRKWGRK